MTGTHQIGNAGAVVRLRNNVGQVVDTLVPQSLNSICRCVKTGIWT